MKRSRWVSTLAVSTAVALLPLALPATSGAVGSLQTFYVEQAGSGTACSESVPCGSIATAIQNGQGTGGSFTVSIGAGTFTDPISISSGTVTLAGTGTSTVLSGQGNGTGITVNGGTVTLTNLTVQDWQTDVSASSSVSLNHVAILSAAGQGLDVGGATASVTSSVFSENGTGILANGPITIQQSSLVGNVVGADLSGTSTLTNDTISANTDSGLIPSGTIAVNFSTISDNGAYGIAPSSGSVSAFATVFDRNQSASCGLNVSDNGYNIDPGSSCGLLSYTGSLSNTEPGLAPLSQYSATAWFAPALPASVSYQNVLSGCTGMLDGRGEARPSSYCSAGSYEYAPATSARILSTPSGYASSSATAGPVTVGLFDQQGFPAFDASGHQFSVVGTNGLFASVSAGGTTTSTIGVPALSTTSSFYVGDATATTALLTLQGDTFAPTSASITFAAGQPWTIASVTGDQQTTTTGSAFARTLSATILDAQGNPVPGISVSFDVSTRGVYLSGQLQTVTATTNALGVADAGTLLAGTSPGSYDVVATGGGLTHTFTEQVVTGPPTSLVIESGNSQTINDSGSLPAPLQVLVTDAFGNAVSNQQVQFQVVKGSAVFTAGGASSDSNTYVTTGTDGIASAGLSVGATGAQSIAVVATVVGSAAHVQFDEYVTVGTPAALTITAGYGQSAATGANFAQLLQINLTDSGNLEVANAPVTFAVVGARAAFAGNVSSVTVKTDSSGVAIAPSLVAGANPGTVTVSVTSGSLTELFEETVVTGPVASLTIYGGDSQSIVDQGTFFNSLQVKATDAFGNPVVNGSVEMQVVAGTASFTSGTFSSPSNTYLSTDATGVAGSGLTVTTAGSQTITIVVSIPGTGLRAQFNEYVTVGPPGSLSIVTGNNQAAPTGATFGQALSVQLSDASGLPLAGTSILFSSNNGNVAFSGNVSSVVSTTNAAGIATAPALIAGSNGGSTATITATVLGDDQVSTSFSESVMTGSPAIAWLSSGDAQSDFGQGTYADALTLQVTDIFSNPIAGAVVQYHVVSGPGSFTVNGNASSVLYASSDSSGNASATLSHQDQVGKIVVVATVMGTNQSVTFQEFLTQSPTYSVTTTFGGDQSTAINSAFPDPISVQALDQWGNPVPGDRIYFSIASGQGSFANGHSAVTETTGIDGIAQAPALSAGGQLGLLSVNARSLSTNVSDVTNETVLVGAATTLTITAGQSQTVAAGSTPQALSFLVNDAAQNPVPGAVVQVTVDGALYTGTTANDGTVTIQSASISAVGHYDVTCSVEGASQASARTVEIIVAGAPHHLTITSSSEIAGTPGNVVGPTMKVQVTDDYGNVVSGAAVRFVMSSNAANFGNNASVFNANSDSAGMVVARPVIAGLLMKNFTVTAVPAWPGVTPTDVSAAPVFSGTIMRIAPTASTVALKAGSHGYWRVSSSGLVTSFGTAANFGSIHDSKLILGLVPTADGQGYWLADEAGRVYAFGDAPHYSQKLHAPEPSVYVSFNVTPDGQGYWLTTSKGLVVPFGDATDYPIRSNSTQRGTVIAMAPTSDGRGYWLLSKRGGVTAYGDAHFFGDETTQIVSPVVSVGSGFTGGGEVQSVNGTLQGVGYSPVINWAGSHRTQPHVVSLVPTPDGGGYWITNSWGQLISFGDAPWRTTRYLPSNLNFGVAIANPAIDSVIEVTPSQGMIPTQAVSVNPKTSPHAIVASTPLGFGLWTLSKAGVLNEYGSAVHVRVPARLNLTGALAMASSYDSRGLFVVTSTHAVASLGDAMNISLPLIRSLSGQIEAVATAYGNDQLWALTSTGKVYLLTPRHAILMASHLADSVAIEGTNGGAAALVVSSRGRVIPIRQAKVFRQTHRLSSVPVVGIINGVHGYWLVQVDGVVTPVGRP